MDSNESKDKNRSPLMLWVKRLGLAGFLFFLIKGLIWLAVIFGIHRYFN